MNEFTLLIAVAILACALLATCCFVMVCMRDALLCVLCDACAYGNVEENDDGERTALQSDENDDEEKNS